MQLFLEVISSRNVCLHFTQWPLERTKLPRCCSTEPYTAALLPFTLHTDDQPRTSQCSPHRNLAFLLHPNYLSPSFVTPSQFFVCCVGLHQPPPLHHSSISEPLLPATVTAHALGSPCTAADGEPHWCWAGRRQLSGCEGLHLG